MGTEMLNTELQDDRQKVMIKIWRNRSDTLQWWILDSCPRQQATLQFKKKKKLFTVVYDHFYRVMAEIKRFTEKLCFNVPTVSICDLIKYQPSLTDDIFLTATSDNVLSGSYYLIVSTCWDKINCLELSWSQAWSGLNPWSSCFVSVLSCKWTLK